MKTKKSLLVALTAVLLGSLGYAAKQEQVEKVDAVAGEIWGLVGSAPSLDWNTDKPLTYKTKNENGLNHATYEIVVDLTAGTLFKFRKDNAWIVSVGPGGMTPPGGITTSADNFLCNETATWRLALHENISGYSDKSYAFALAEQVVVTKHNVTYVNGPATIKNVAVTEGTAYIPEYIEVPGYRLEGWYTDQALETKFVKNTVITAPLTLYGNYVLGQTQELYVKNRNNWDNVYAYMWNEELGNHNGNGSDPTVGWPGIKMTLVAGTSSPQVYYYEVPAEANFDKLIFNNGVSGGATEKKTIDLDVTYGPNIIYDMDTGTGSNLPGEHYESSTKKVLLEGEMISTLETECFAYTGSVVGASDVYWIHLSGGVVATEIVTDSTERIELISEFIMLGAGCDTTVDTLRKLNDLYDSLTELEKADPLMADVSARLDYIGIILSLQNNPSNVSIKESGIYNTTKNRNIVILIVIGMVSAMVIGGLYYLNKRRYAE